MKVYWCDPRTRAMHSAEAPDGSMLLAIGATMLTNGKQGLPIDMIDYVHGVYERGGLQLPFPEKTYEMRDLTWEPPLPEWAR